MLGPTNISQNMIFVELPWSTNIFFYIEIHRDCQNHHQVVLVWEGSLKVDVSEGYCG